MRGRVYWSISGVTAFMIRMENATPSGKFPNVRITKIREAGSGTKDQFAAIAGGVVTGSVAMKTAHQ